MLILLCALAEARDRWSVDARADADVLEAAWTDGAGADVSIAARFPVGALQGAPSLTFDMVELRRALVARIQAWAAEHAPQVEVTLRGEEIGYTARGDGGRAAVERVEGERERLYDALVSERRLTRLDAVTLQFDAARIAADAAPALAPLLPAFGDATDLRTFASRALGFVQAIPYDRGGRSAFATPLALLRTHLGDCDEKSTLFLGILRAAAPTLGLAMFTTEGHAWVGLDLPARAGEAAVDVDGTSWLVAEPVGPALAPLGELSPVSQAALKRGAIRVFRVP
jgi:hypothetical protein